MSGVPFAIPLAWTWDGSFFLHRVSFAAEIGSDCLRHRELIR
jgi:hypothetical protein